MHNLFFRAVLVSSHCHLEHTLLFSPQIDILFSNLLPALNFRHLNFQQLYSFVDEVLCSSDDVSLSVQPQTQAPLRQ